MEGWLVEHPLIAVALTYVAAMCALTAPYLLFTGSPIPAVATGGVAVGLLRLVWPTLR